MRSGIPIVRNGRDLRLGLVLLAQVLSQVRVGAASRREVVQKQKLEISAEAEARREQYSSAEGEQDEQRPEEVLLARGEGEQDEQLVVGQQLLEVVERGLSRKNGFFPSGTQEREQGYEYDEYTDEAEEEEFAGAAGAPAAKKLRKRKKAAEGEGEERDATGSFVERRDAADLDSAGDGVAEDAVSAGDGVAEDADSTAPEHRSSTFLDTELKGGGLLNSCCGDAVLPAAAVANPREQRRIDDEWIRKNNEERTKLGDQFAPPDWPAGWNTTTSTTSIAPGTTTSTTTTTCPTGGVNQVELRGLKGHEQVKLKCLQGDETQYTRTLYGANVDKFYDLPCCVGVDEEFTIEFTNDNGPRDVFVTDQDKHKTEKNKQPFEIKLSEDTAHPPVVSSSCSAYNSQNPAGHDYCTKVQDGSLLWKGVHTLKVKEP